MSQLLTNSTKNKMQVQVQEEEDDDLVILPAVDNSELQTQPGWKALQTQPGWKALERRKAQC